MILLPFFQWNKPIHLFNPYWVEYYFLLRLFFSRNCRGYASLDMYSFLVGLDMFDIRNICNSIINIYPIPGGLPRTYRRISKNTACIAYSTRFLGFLCFLISFQTPALELFDKFQVHGFASQGLFYTSANNMIGDSAGTVSADFTELGINGSWTPLAKLRFSMQVLSRRAGSGHDGTPLIDFGLMDYSLFDQDHYRLGIRLGRVRLPYGLYNDTRDVAFTRPSVLLPQGIYPERTRDYTLSADGGMIYGEFRNPWGNLSLELLTGYQRTDDPDLQRAILGRKPLGKFNSELSFVGRLSYEVDDGRLRFALTGGHGVINYQPNYASKLDPFLPGRDIFSPVVFSAQYNGEKWTLTSEFSLRPIKNSGFGPLLDYDILGDSYYFQAAYRFAPKWEVMARYDALYNNMDDPQGLKLQAETNGIIPAYTQYAKNWTIGLRYDITPWLMVRGEYNYVNGTAWLPQTDNSIPSQTTKYWDMFAFILSARF